MSFEHPTLAICKGDSVDSVRDVLGLNVSPEPMSEPDTSGSFYHLAELGFWVFFNENNQVYSIRFDSSYPYAIEGIRIGDTKEKVINMIGKPHRRFPLPDRKDRWFYDKPRFLRVDFDTETNRVEKIFR